MCRIHGNTIDVLLDKAISPLDDQGWVRDPANLVVEYYGSTIVCFDDPGAQLDSLKLRLCFRTVGTEEEYASIGYSELADGDTRIAPEIVLPPPGGNAWDNQKVEIRP